MKLRNKTKMPPLDTKTFENALSDSVVSILNNGASLSFVDLNESVQYCPPQSLPDTICHLNDNIRKDFRYGSTAMPYIDSTIVSMEEIDVDEFDTAASQKVFAAISKTTNTSRGRSYTAASNSGQRNAQQEINGSRRSGIRRSGIRRSGSRRRR